MTKRAQPLEPLFHRRTRLKLLLASYYDAATAADEGEQSEARASDPGTREPRRNFELWPVGSYRAVERCLDALRAKYPQAYRAVQAVYVLGWPVADEQTKQWSRFGLALLLEEMPQTIHVPAVIAENAGHLPSESKLYERRRRG